MPAFSDEGGISLSHKPESLMFMVMSDEVKRKESFSPPFWNKTKK